MIDSEFENFEDYINYDFLETESISSSCSLSETHLTKNKETQNSDISSIVHNSKQIDEKPGSNQNKRKRQFTKKEENELKIQEDMINTLQAFKDSIYETNPCQSPVHLFMESVAKQIEEANLSYSSLLNIQIKILKIIEEEIGKR